jgi:hypothetical protein
MPGAMPHRGMPRHFVREMPGVHSPGSLRVPGMRHFGLRRFCLCILRLRRIRPCRRRKRENRDQGCAAYYRLHRNGSVLRLTAPATPAPSD